MVTAAMSAAYIPIDDSIAPCSMASAGSRGGCRITARSPGSSTGKVSERQQRWPYPREAGAEQHEDAISAERRCLLGRPACDDRHSCPALRRWKAVSTQVADFLRKTTVAELIASTRGTLLHDRPMLSSRSPR